MLSTVMPGGKPPSDLTSLNEGADRLTVVVDMIVAPDGSIASGVIYRALGRNQAQLTYNGVGAWLESSSAAPLKVAASADLVAQLTLQDEAAQILFQERQRLGAFRTGLLRVRYIQKPSHLPDFLAAVGQAVKEMLRACD